LANFGWPERPTKAESKHRETNGDKHSLVFTVGKYRVSVPVSDPDADFDITYQVDRYGRGGNPRDTLPNMEVSDGELRIPVSDLVDTILTRIDPVELAQALWADDDVKEAFMEAMTQRYADHSFSDADRRMFIARVKGEVHEKAVDELAGKMADIERGQRDLVHISNRLYRYNDFLREIDAKDPRTGEVLQLRGVDEDRDFAIGGKHWNETRDYWRKQMHARFPAPELADEEPAELEVPF